MKIRAIATGEIREEGDEAARQLIDAGIYEEAPKEKADDAGPAKRHKSRK